MDSSSCGDSDHHSMEDFREMGNMNNKIKQTDCKTPNIDRTSSF